ncbi:MAG: YqgE/AlgH family protein [Janthinobacterium lividum]
MPKQSKPSKAIHQPGKPPDGYVFPQSSDHSLPPELNLANHFLIAMPSMLDSVFSGSVVYLCEHNPSGALGVIINKPTDMTMDVLLERIDLKVDEAAVPPAKPSAERETIGAGPVMFGGPVQVERGFVLHAPRGEFSSMMKVSDEISLTTSRDVLEAVATGEGPGRLLVTLGCAGWSAGQLEEEIGGNGWLTVAADPQIIFDLPIEARFAAALKLLGVDPLMLSGEAGHA